MNRETILDNLHRLRKGMAAVSDTVAKQLEPILQRLGQAEEDIDALETTVEEQGKKLLAYWEYMKSIYDYECDMPEDTSIVPRTYIERLKEGDTVKGTCEQTINADGTYTYVYKIGETTRTQTWTKVNNQWRGVWS